MGVGAKLPPGICQRTVRHLDLVDLLLPCPVPNVSLFYYHWIMNNMSLDQSGVSSVSHIERDTMHSFLKGLQSAYAEQYDLVQKGPLSRIPHPSLYWSNSDGLDEEVRSHFDMESREKNGLVHRVVDGKHVITRLFGERNVLYPPYMSQSIGLKFQFHDAYTRLLEKEWIDMPESDEVHFAMSGVYAVQAATHEVLYVDGWSSEVREDGTRDLDYLGVRYTVHFQDPVEEGHNAREEPLTCRFTRDAPIWYASTRLVVDPEHTDEIVELSYDLVVDGYDVHLDRQQGRRYAILDAKNLFVMDEQNDSKTLELRAW